MTAATELEDLDVLATVFDVARIGICIITADGRFSKVNPEFCRMVGYGEGDLIGQPYWLCAPPGVAAVHDKFLAAAMADSRKLPSEWQIRRRDGALFDALVSFRPVTRANGQRFIVVTFSDITERNASRARIEQLNADLEDRIRARTSALEESERKYRRIIDVSQEGFWLVDGWGRTLEVNQSLCDMLGRSAEELMRAKPEEMFAEPYRDTIRARIYPRPRVGLGQFEMELLNRQGECVPVLINTVTQVNDAGEPEFGAAFFTDISRRKQLERTLEQTLSEREAILDNSVVGIGLVRDRQFVWANRALEQHILGFEPGELIGRQTRPLFPSEADYQRFGDEAYSALSRGETYETEVEFRRKDGSSFWCYLTGRAIKPGDLSAGTIWVQMDVTERHTLQEYLRATVVEREAVLQSSVVGIAFVRDRHFVWTNKAFEQDMLGFDPGELAGKSSILTYPSPELFEELGPRINQILMDRGMFQIEERVRRKDGNLIWCLVSGRMVDRTDLSKGSIWTIVDISKRKAAEAELLESLAREKEASELKSRFVSMTSHEFRTPLAAIMSSTELLADYGDRLPATEKTELIEVIKSSVRRMTQMLEDILVIGKADAGRLDYKPGPVSIDALLERIVQEVRRTTQTTHELRIDNRLPRRTLWLDQRLFTHVLQNLLINAIKYSPKGDPVSVQLEPDGNGVRITVVDQGIGIPEADRAALFTSFHRGGNVGNISGTGLGLAIVKKAVDLHRGHIEVQSVLGKGSRFTVTLPDARG